MSNLFKVGALQLQPTLQAVNIAITCPVCGHKGVFAKLVDDRDVLDINSGSFFLRRMCPNQNCRSYIFALQDGPSKQLITFPASYIHFDRNNIPTAVLDAFEEAVKCHSIQCYVASAIMIRKTLEVLCLDKAAQGGNLFQKIANLAQTIMIPQELKNAMQDIRLLGNDAAHIEAQTYDQIGKEEIEISIEFTKEILKAIYQYDSLLQRLRGLKRPSQMP